MGNGISAVDLKRILDALPPEQAQQTTFAPDPGGGGLQVRYAGHVDAIVTWDGQCRVTNESSPLFSTIGQAALAGATGQGSQAARRQT